MQSAKDYLKAEIQRRLEQAKGLTDQAEASARTLTSDERKQVETLLEEAEGFKSRVHDMEENERLRDAIETRFDKPVEEVTTEAKSIGDAFVKSDGYQGLLQRGFKGTQWSTGAVELPFDGKATVTTATAPGVIAADMQSGIQELRLRRLTIADLLASGTTDSNAVSYPRLNSETNAAAATAEGDLKPEGALGFNTVTEPVRKIATFLPVSDEMLEDMAGLRSFIDGRLRLHVQHTEEAQILSGTGVGANLSGLLTRTGLQTVAKTAGQSIADVIYTAMTNIRQNAFAEPDGIVIHPTNWAAVRTAKDANGQYYAGGPFMGQYGQGGLATDNIWGVPVVVTSAIAVNTALVGAFGTEAQVFRRNGLTVEASNSHADFFQRNLTAIRAEERLALAVYRPAAFHSITALNV